MPEYIITSGSVQETYAEMVNDFERAGQQRNIRTLTEVSGGSMIAMAAVAAAATGPVVTFTSTPGRYSSYCGQQDVTPGLNTPAAYAFGLIAADTGDNECADFTAVQVVLFDPVSKQFANVDTVYVDVTLTASKAATNYPVKRKNPMEQFRFDKGALLSGSQEQIWNVIKPDVSIAVANSHFKGTYDLWV